MKRSTDRILTTHTGSLPRPKDLLRLLQDHEEGRLSAETRLPSRTRAAVLERHSYLSAEQQEAVQFITSEKSIEALTGFAGAGKSAAIAAARDTWQAEGLEVRV